MESYPGVYKQIRGPSFGYDHGFVPVDKKARHLHADALAWCTERFGPQAGEPGSTVAWGEAFGHILFDNANDAMLFKLTWA
jgi:hypothetical protein